MLPASVLVLARGLLGLLSLGASATCEAYSVDIEEYIDAKCDDGTKVFDINGELRLECTIEGCGPIDELCYRGTYFEQCLDTYGRKTGRCDTHMLECEGTIACAFLWIDCKGTWGCDSPNKLVGCRKGHCEEKKD